MATLRETDRDREIIDRILEEHPHLRGNRSGAVRVALEYWATDRDMLDAEAEVVRLMAAAEAARHAAAQEEEEEARC